MCSYGCSNGACNSPPAQNQGGGGGGGGGIFISSCKENWTCTDWSSCIGGVQNRSCKDQDKCGITKSKPTESQSCIVPNQSSSYQSTKSCIEDWICTGWSDCTNGTQKRTCVDKNTCGTTISKPLESQLCITETVQGSFAPTGLFLGLTSYELLVVLLAGLLIVSAIIFIAKRRQKKTVLDDSAFVK